jgi:hypothetical protein
MDISKATLDPSYKEYMFSSLPPIKAVVFDVKTENTPNETLNWHVAQ